VHGEDGYGKSDITNYAAKYALEGRVELCSAHHIKIEQITTKKGLKDKILVEIAKHISCDKLLSKSNTVEDYFKDHKYLVILDKCQSFVNYDK
jgi:hypothetical protein